MDFAHLNNNNIVHMAHSIGIGKLYQITVVAVAQLLIVLGTSVEPSVNATRIVQTTILKSWLVAYGNLAGFCKNETGPWIGGLELCNSHRRFSKRLI